MSLKVRALSTLLVASVVVACTAGEDSPATGTYTIQFPSTAAAIATDSVQLLVFDVPSSPNDRAVYCQTLIQARKRKDPQKPILSNPPVNICELLLGRRPITLPYGEKAILAIAQRRALGPGVDFMVGCAVQTLGAGDAPLPIALGLVDVANAVPEPAPNTPPCTSVGDFCDKKCVAP